MAKALGEFEQLILFALLSLPEGAAYGVTIREAIEERTGRTLAAGPVHTALDRLEDKGLVSSWVGGATAERGGRRKRFYRLEALGAEALERAVRTFQEMSRGLLPKLKAVRTSGPGGRES